MYTIKNAKIEMYSFSNKVSWIVAKREEQDILTLKAIGKGKMLTVPDNQLKYDLGDDITIFLE